MPCARCATATLRAESIGLDATARTMDRLCRRRRLCGAGGRALCLPQRQRISRQSRHFVVDRRTGRWCCSAASARSPAASSARRSISSLSIWVISHTDYSKLVLGVLIVAAGRAVSQGRGRRVRGLAKRARPARREDAMSILAVEHLGKSYSRLPGGQRRELRARGGRDARADRAERRGQEHLLQHDQRPARADARAHPHFRSAHRRHGAARNLAPRASGGRSRSPRLSPR